MLEIRPKSDAGNLSRLSQPFPSRPPSPGSGAGYTFKDKTVGAYLTLRVRGNGSKGPSLWTDTTTIRIN